MVWYWYIFSRPLAAFLFVSAYTVHSRSKAAKCRTKRIRICAFPSTRFLRECSPPSGEVLYQPCNATSECCVVAQLALPEWGSWNKVWWLEIFSWVATSRYRNLLVASAWGIGRGCFIAWMEGSWGCGEMQHSREWGFCIAFSVGMSGGKTSEILQFLWKKQKILGRIWLEVWGWGSWFPASFSCWVTPKCRNMFVYPPLSLRGLMLMNVMFHISKSSWARQSCQVCLTAKPRKSLGGLKMKKRFVKSNGRQSGRFGCWCRDKAQDQEQPYPHWYTLPVEVLFPRSNVTAALYISALLLYPIHHSLQPLFFAFTS